MEAQLCLQAPETPYVEKIKSIICILKALREEIWARRHYNMPGDDEGMYWDDRRRYEEEYMDMVRHGNMGPFPRGRPFPGGAPPVSLILTFNITTSLNIFTVLPRRYAPKGRV